MGKQFFVIISNNKAFAFMNNFFCIHGCSVFYPPLYPFCHYIFHSFVRYHVGGVMIALTLSSVSMVDVYSCVLLIKWTCVMVC